jgi:hypothetical protein
MADGPFAGAGLDEPVGDIAGNGAGAIVLHQGAVRRVRPQWFVDLSLIVHLDPVARPAAGRVGPMWTLLAALRSAGRSVGRRSGQSEPRTLGGSDWATCRRTSSCGNASRSPRPTSSPLASADGGDLTPDVVPSHAAGQAGVSVRSWCER